MGKEKVIGKIPRIVIAGAASGVGKTTVAIGIMAALAQRGLKVQGFKVGPDYIDPSYYRAATGRTGRNLDSWLISRKKLIALFVKNALDTDLAVVEGVMGLFDGLNGESERASTAEIAKLLRAKVILVLDCQAMSRSVAALALGFQKFDPELELAGFILNKVASWQHYQMAKRAITQTTELPILGYFTDGKDIRLPERYLGLVPAPEKSLGEEFYKRLAKKAEAQLELDYLIKIANQIPPLSVNQPRKQNVRYPGVRLAVAFDSAFNFYYQDNLDILEALGAKLCFFSPISDQKLPDRVDGLYLGGGFPELLAERLALNETLRREIKRAAQSGLPIYAECGGLIYLSKEVVDSKGISYPMVGVLPVKCRITEKLFLGYREVITLTKTPLFEKGMFLRGHEFHYSVAKLIDPQGVKPAYEIKSLNLKEGFVKGNVLASYIHLHFAGCISLAEEFVKTCVNSRF
jgi:cobyrinic acid a,c-diamide synthase